MEVKITIGDAAMLAFVAWAVAFAIVGLVWAVMNYHPFG